MSRMSEIAADLSQLGELDALRAENARLREHLEEACNALTCVRPFFFARRGVPYKSSRTVVEEARAALTPRPCRADAAPAGWDDGSNVR